MKITINYQEISQLTGGKFKFTRVSDSEIMVKGTINLALIKKDISTTLKLERVGYSSVDLSTTTPVLISTGLLFLDEKTKKAVTKLDDGKIKIDLKKITDITKRLKMDSITFEDTEILIKLSPRP